MWYHVIDWADQSTVMSVTPAAKPCRVCVSSYKGLNHHFEVVDKTTFFDDLMSEQLVEKISASQAKALIQSLALDSIERIFSDDLG